MQPSVNAIISNFSIGNGTTMIAEFSRRVRDSEAPAALATGVSVLTKRCKPLQLRLGRRCGSFFRLVGR